VAYTFGGYAL
jgi:lipopolysaccharide/colanic/teichoic acid biosynthesis glycosyltransferase